MACKIFLRVPYVNTPPPHPGHEVFWAWKSDRISIETGCTTYWLCEFGRVAYLLWTSSLKGRIIWSWDETRLWMWKSNTVFYLDFKLSSCSAHTSGNPYRTESLEGVPETGPTLLKIVSYPERTANTWWWGKFSNSLNRLVQDFLTWEPETHNAQDPWGMPGKAQRCKGMEKKQAQPILTRGICVLVGTADILPLPSSSL